MPWWVTDRCWRCAFSTCPVREHYQAPPPLFNRFVMICKTAGCKRLVPFPRFRDWVTCMPCHRQAELRTDGPSPFVVKHPSSTRRIFQRRRGV